MDDDVAGVLRALDHVAALPLSVTSSSVHAFATEMFDRGDRPGGVTIQELVPTTRKRIALVAHDNKKADLLAWARYNRQILVRHELVATGTTGRLLAGELGLDVRCLQSGPLGGDQQLGAEVTIGEIDLVLFFWDPLEPQPHDPDVRALLRIAVVWNVPIACNRATADYVISSPLLSTTYQREMPSYDADIWRASRPA